MEPYGNDATKPAPASADDWSAWASVPWTRVTDLRTTPATTTTSGITITASNSTGTDSISSTTIGWHKAGVPYLPQGKAVALQTLDLWIPNTSTSDTSTPDASTLPSAPGGAWIIYIHGGAWRDPAITSSSFTPAATNLLQRASQSAPDNLSQTATPPQATPSPPKLAGLISLNYRLSPHPSHPAPSDPSRQAKHPDHISDVLAALSFLHRLLGTTTGPTTEGTETGVTTTTSSREVKWILTGHSCGATLAFQAVMSPLRWGLPASSGIGLHKPGVIVGFNGLYDLAGFIREPPEGYEWLREGYREFVEGAFGGDERVWRGVCPATAGEGWVREWIGGGGDGNKKGKVVLVQSRGDTLVPWRQVESMWECLEREGSGIVEVKVLEADGEHDEIWRDGQSMAEVLWEVVEGLE